jgi:hypothetical protein
MISLLNFRRWIFFAGRFVSNDLRDSNKGRGSYKVLLYFYYDGYKDAILTAAYSVHIRE